MRSVIVYLIVRKYALEIIILKEAKTFLFEQTSKVPALIF